MPQNSELDKILEKATKDFRKKVSRTTNYPIFNMKCRGQDTQIQILSNDMKTKHLPKVCPVDRTRQPLINSDEFVQHFKDLEPYAQFSSSRESFAKLNDMEFTHKQGKPYLNKRQVDVLRQSGALLHTYREKNDRVFDTRMRGLQFGNQQSTSTRGLVRTMGSKMGEYDDKFSREGFTFYAPPCQPSGMLRFRWLQFLKQRFDVPMFFLFVRWFFLESPIHDHTTRSQWGVQAGKTVFMITPVTIVSDDVQKKYENFFFDGGRYSSDLRNLGRTIKRPLPLQMIEPEDCFKIIYNLETMNSGNQKFGDRKYLTPNLIQDYNYDSLTGTSLEKKLERWAKNTGKRCPDGRMCNNTRFDDPTIGPLHLGHIISQDWCKAFKLDPKFMNHPYNLYLTCGSCNRSLNKHFPSQNLQNRLDNDKATIGDWIYSYDAAIRATTP